MGQAVSTRTLARLYVYTLMATLGALTGTLVAVATGSTLGSSTAALLVGALVGWPGLTLADRLGDKVGRCDSCGQPAIYEARMWVGPPWKRTLARQRHACPRHTDELLANLRDERHQH